MKRFIASLLAMVGVSVSVSAEPPKKVDLSSALFTVPTISNDLPPLQPVTNKPGSSDFLFHEDDWCQVEFIPETRLPLIQKLLTEYRAHEAKNRVQFGENKQYVAWKSVYVRKFDRVPIVQSASAVKDLESLLNIKTGSSPVLHSTSEITGRVKGGFSFPLGGKIVLYGYADSNAVPILGAHVEQGADYQKLVEVFKKLRTKHRLVIVDWRQQLVILSVSADGSLENWRP